MHIGARFQTLQRSFQAICQGEDPWIALGKFSHQFFGEYQGYREALLCDPLILLEPLTAEQFRWAVFCAASAVYLCEKYTLVCPSWALDPQYRLETPWYSGIGSDLPSVQEKLRQSTPEAFQQRNVFCGDRVYRNKYEQSNRRRSA